MSIIMPPGILAASRARLTPYYALFPPIGIVPSALPGFTHTVARIQAAPPLGAKFVQMLLEIGPTGGTQENRNDGLEHFFYVLEGNLWLTIDSDGATLQAGDYAYLPPGVTYGLRGDAPHGCKVSWLKRAYHAIDLPAPAPRIGRTAQVAPTPGDVTGAYSRRLLPVEDMAFDMAMNILYFKPGVYFDFVETHIMEHGLTMLQGQGIYYLAGDLHEVQTHDYVYMAPFCPQFFFCTGWGEAAYLLYKDINRDLLPEGHA